MNHWLDQSLVGLLLLASMLYALLTLGPKSLRLRILAGAGRAARHAPHIFALSRWARKLEEAAAKPKGVCGGCEDCGAQSTAAPPPTEINIPIGKIGRRS